MKYKKADQVRPIKARLSDSFLEEIRTYAAKNGLKKQDFIGRILIEGFTAYRQEARDDKQ